MPWASARPSDVRQMSKPFDSWVRCQQTQQVGLMAGGSAARELPGS